MQLRTDDDRKLLAHLIEQIDSDTPYLWRTLDDDFSCVSVSRFAQAGLLIPRGNSSYDIVVGEVEDLAESSAESTKTQQTQVDSHPESLASVASPSLKFDREHAEECKTTHTQRKFIAAIAAADNRLNATAPEIAAADEFDIKCLIENNLIAKDGDWFRCTPNGLHHFCLEADSMAASAIQAVKEHLGQRGDEGRGTAPAQRSRKLKGSQDRRILNYLTEHHKYESGRCENFIAAESADIAKSLRISASTVSDYLKRHFKSNGQPRMGYMTACSKSREKLLHWFMVQHKDNLPVRTVDLSNYDTDDLKARW